MTVWDGAVAAKGSGWKNVTEAGEVAFAPRTAVAHRGTTALELRAKGLKWLGAGWNWTAYANGAGTDVRAINHFVLWLEHAGRGGVPEINLLCGDREFDTPAHHTEKVHLVKHCPKLNDAAQRKVWILLGDLDTVPGLDFTRMAELHMGMFTDEKPVDCSFFLDDLGFE